MAVDERLRGDLAGFSQHEIAALTDPDNSVVGASYGATEQAVLINLRTRVNEIEAALQAAGILP